MTDPPSPDVDDEGNCAQSSLPTEMCAHCRGLLDKEPPATAEQTREALFPSACPNCANRIRPGDTIGLIDGSWLCQECAR